MLKFDASIFGGELPVRPWCGWHYGRAPAAISSMRICLLGMRRSRHWDVRTPSSDSARSSQLYDGLGMREVDVGQVFQDASVIHGGMAICDLDVAPAFERS